jgi:putative nucleotidyltransferase with HDIG domain
MFAGHAEHGLAICCQTVPPRTSFGSPPDLREAEMSVAPTHAVPRAVAAPSRERVELILNHLDRLPALPGVVARLITVTSSEDSSARDVVSIIESDAALTAGILRLVRRADLGVRTQSMTVTKAVTLLGMRTVRNAALSSQFFETLSLKSGDDAESKTRAGLWEHSLAVACAAELIAERIGGNELAGDAFVCGLLHDIGKIALDVCLPKSYAKAADYAQRRHACISEVETEVFGLDHTVAGKRLTTRWHLPQAVQECVWLHHQNPDDLPSTLGHAQLVRIVHLADNLVRKLGIGFSGYQHVDAVEQLAAPLGLGQDAVDQVIHQLPERMKPIREVLGLGEPGEPAETPLSNDVQQRLIQSNARLSAENERLALGSKCLDAVARFTSLVSENDLLGDVCAAAAETLAGMFEVESVLVYAQRGASRNVHAGLYSPSDIGRRAVVVEVDESLSEPTSSGSQKLWRSVTRSAAPPSLRAIPIEVVGIQAGVLLYRPDRPALPLQTNNSSWALLSRTIGLAIAWSGARSDSEAMTQELLDLNRRCREAESKLVRMRSISMVGEMAAGAAHELNNPLAVISGRAQMELDLAVEPERRRAMEIVVEQAKKASQIVLDLMKFAKPDAPTPKRLPLQQVVRHALQHWKQPSVAPRGQFNIGNLDPALTVFADTAQLQEIITNVIENALQACSSIAGRVQINSPSRASDETVRIVVSDSGPGMSPEVLEHAFDPFFSHRPAGRGRGMGLTRAYRLAEINGGRLWIDSKPGTGTTVTIELPSQAPTA